MICIEWHESSWKQQLIHIRGGLRKSRGGFLKETSADLNCEQSVGVIKAEEDLWGQHRQKAQYEGGIKQPGGGKEARKSFRVTKAQHVRREAAGDKGREVDMRQAVC